MQRVGISFFLNSTPDMVAQHLSWFSIHLLRHDLMKSNDDVSLDLSFQDLSSSGDVAISPESAAGVPVRSLRKLFVKGLRVTTRYDYLDLQQHEI